MRITEIGKEIDLLDEKQNSFWIGELSKTLKDGVLLPKELSLRKLVVALYGFVNKLDEEKTVIAYGAGNMGQKFIPQIQSHINVHEIWDNGAQIGNLNDIRVVKPYISEELLSVPIVIFIDNDIVVHEIIGDLESKGYTNVYWYKEYIELLESCDQFADIRSNMTHHTEESFASFMNQYDSTGQSFAAINYSVVPKALKSKKRRFDNSKENQQELKAQLHHTLLISDENMHRIDSAIDALLAYETDNLFDFAMRFELYLREVLSNGVKTKKRPIRMHSDTHYDQFAAYEVMKITLMYVCSSGQEKDTVRGLRKLAPATVPLISLECFFLIKAGEYEEALALSRQAVRKEPNGLLANETFYQVALQCRQNGIYAGEPLPEYDLNERYCWSGLTFVQCYGFDKNEKAVFFPCFRNHQCDAAPKGDFWTGEEWQEFRSSILDGSFRYCQKNNCPNILGGWLPKKSECTHSDMLKLLSGEKQSAPSPEELHLSYDSHCNLCCPSCRTEICVNSREDKEKLDRLFEKNLRPLLKKAKHMCLSGCGEAILSPHSRDIIKSLSQQEYPDLCIELRTNVFCFTPEAWNGLGEGRKVIKHVAASIDAASKELFEMIRFPAKWERVKDNLRFIQSLRNEGEIEQFEFHTVIQNENIEELMDIIKMAVDFDADVITFSRLVNWRGMSEEEYHEINPFWHDHPKHERLMQVIGEIRKLREEIEEGCSKLDLHKKLYINMHGIPDANVSYDPIRVGKLKIR